MKRKITHILLSMLCIALLLPIFSASATEDESVVVVDDGVFYFTKETGTIHGYNKHTGQPFEALVIPDELDGVPVTAIADCAFRNQECLESVTLPNTLEHLGAYAFENCDELKSITIPDSVTSIGTGAFTDCYHLASVTFGSGLTAIPNEMFYWCEALMDVTFGENITSIGDSAFYTCSGLTKLTLPESLKSIGNNAFYNCSWLTDVTFGKNLEVIGDEAFSSCYALTSITIPDSVTSIGKQAFEACHAVKSVKIGKGLSSLGYDALQCGNELVSITVDAENKYFSTDESGILFNKDKTEILLCPQGYKGAYTIPESVTAIAENTFIYRDGLTEVTIGENVKTIGNSAFYGCSGLTKITIPNNVTHIGDFAFAACGELKEITIGSGVESIGKEAFSYCTKLTTLSVDEENKHYFSDAASVLFGKSGNELLQAPATISGTYTIPEGTKVIKSYAFENCSDLTDIVIPGSVETIEEYAFASCTALKSIVIPEGVKRIEVGAFSYCDALKDITLPDSLEHIGASAFLSTAHSNNKSNWDEKILYIGNHLIASESTKNKIVIREGTRTIASYAFSYGNQTSIVLPESLVGIGAHAFYCCDLTQVTIPKNVAHIEEGAFSECSALTAIDVDAENKNYCSDESGVLYDKQKTALLQLPGTFSGKYVIPNSVKTIENFSILCVSNLTRLTIPKSVTKIGEISLDYYNNCDVYYTGSKADWQKIDIHEYSIDVFEGRVIFNYVPVDQLPGTIPFKDVKATDYFATPVLWASANKITSGVSATSFAPNAACTRAQIATLLWRAKGSPEPFYNDNPFSDVKQGDYYYKAVLWAYENYIIYGTSETTFSPNDPCTRGQVATLLQRISYNPEHEAENPFSDVDVEDYYYDGVLWAYENGITDGVGGGKFAPNATCTRAQIATFLFRAMA